MNKLLKSFVRETTPPLIFRGLRSLFHLLFPDKKKKREMKSWGERSAEWYDGVYGAVLSTVSIIPRVRITFCGQ